jgi:hypothetical protein
MLARYTHPNAKRAEWLEDAFLDATLWRRSSSWQSQRADGTLRRNGPSAHVQEHRESERHADQRLTPE